MGNDAHHSNLDEKEQFLELKIHAQALEVRWALLFVEMITLVDTTTGRESEVD